MRHTRRGLRYSFASPSPRRRSTRTRLHARSLRFWFTHGSCGRSKLLCTRSCLSGFSETGRGQRGIPSPRCPSKPLLAARADAKEFVVRLHERRRIQRVRRSAFRSEDRRADELLEAAWRYYRKAGMPYGESRKGFALSHERPARRPTELAYSPVGSDRSSSVWSRFAYSA